MKTHEWPFVPDHITNDRDEVLKGVGITPNRQLEGQLTAIAGKLRNPVMLVEFPTDGDKSPYHTQGKSIQFELRPACESFRTATNGKHCSYVEDRLANLFRNLDVSNLASGFSENVEQDDVVKGYTAIPDYCFNLKEHNSRHYLECDCPILGYRALAFPVIIENRIIGVLYIGQLCLHDRLGFIESVMENNRGGYENCVEQVLQIHGEWVHNPKHILRANKYQRLITEAIDELGRLEHTLTEQLNRQREDFIEKRVADYVRSLYHDLSKMSTKMPLGTKGLEELWGIVESRLEEIRRDFKLEYICLFGTKKLQIEYPSKLELVAQAGKGALYSPPVTLPKDIQYDLESIPEKAMRHVMVSTRNPELLDALAGGYKLDNKDNFIRILPAFFSPGSMVVTWIRYGSPWNPIADRRYHKSGKALERSIRSFYAVVTSTHASILAVNAIDSMEKSLRVFRHEVGQLTSGMDALRETYISKYQKLEDLSPKKADDLNRDWEDYLRQMHLLSDKAGMILEIPCTKKKHFQAFRQLLFKWKDTFRLEAAKKHIQLTIASVESDDPLRPQIYGDEALLEQLVYNLLNNAVKYCHPGTKIRMDCRKTDEGLSSPHVLTVTNYGIEIETTNRLYELGQRGRNVAGSEGLGIGLYIVAQIAEAHHGDYKHSCQKVSRYNVPLIEAYLNTDFPDKDADLAQAIIKELANLKSSGDYQKVVALDENGTLKHAAPTPNELVDLINKQTWQVTFEITIPSF